MGTGCPGKNDGTKRRGRSRVGISGPDCLNSLEKIVAGV